MERKEELQEQHSAAPEEMQTGYWENFLSKYGRTPEQLPRETVDATWPVRVQEALGSVLNMNGLVLSPAVVTQLDLIIFVGLFQMIYYKHGQFSFSFFELHKLSEGFLCLRGMRDKWRME